MFYYSGFLFPTSLLCVFVSIRVCGGIVDTAIHHVIIYRLDLYYHDTGTKIEIGVCVRVYVYVCVYTCMCVCIVLSRCQRRP